MATFIVVLFIAVCIVGAVVKIRTDGGGQAERPRLRGCGVVVDGDQVKSSGRVIGQLAGSRAEITGLTARHTLTRAVTVVGAATKKTDFMVVITFANGQMHTWKGTSAGEFRRAAEWVSKYNAMSGPDYPATPLASA